MLGHVVIELQHWLQVVVLVVQDRVLHCVCVWLVHD